ncbi:MAG TPA: heavy metal sensor histidine kinase [Gammaproteobacteria bacterium]|jgi:heavy metal sensor kinase|nr:heavy metal sensor histidine kinase [Gammaproteobacteria bacterium]
MRLHSIGARLTLWFTAAFTAALLLLGVVIWLIVRQSLYAAIDEGLRDRVEGIRRFIEDHESRLLQDEVKEEFRAHGDFFLVIDERGQVIHRGDALEGATLEPLPAGSAARLSDGTLAGEPLRFLARPVTVGGQKFTIEAAAPLGALQHGLRNAAWLLAAAVPVALALAAAGGYWLSRRALAPVDRITATARAIGAQNLAQRLDVAPADDELARLSRTLNDMIARLEAAFQKITRFTADASHELRTPLAVMRTTAEVALRAPPGGAEERAALEQIVAEIERTSQLVENLLLIAKADSGAAELNKRSVDLVAAVREACTEAEVLARVKGLALTAELPDASLRVHGDRDALRRLFLILLDNAVKYTPAGGSLSVALRAQDGVVVGTVRDTGVGIPSEHLPHVFDRFYRVDRARSRIDGGAGLGLAIGRWIAEAHGGRILVESEAARGSSFHVHLPHE